MSFWVILLQKALFPPIWPHHMLFAIIYFLFLHTDSQNLKFLHWASIFMGNLPVATLHTLLLQYLFTPGSHFNIYFSALVLWDHLFSRYSRLLYLIFWSLIRWCHQRELVKGFYQRHFIKTISEYSNPLGKIQYMSTFKVILFLMMVSYSRYLITSSSLCWC